MSVVERAPMPRSARVALDADRLTLERAVPRRTYLGTAAKRFRANRLAVGGLAVVIVVICLALGAGVISSNLLHKQPYHQDLGASYAGIGEEGYLLGADEFGRDTAVRLLYGARVSLGVALLSLLAALTIGVTAGLSAGFYGGWLDALLMRLVDAMLAIPSLFLLLLVASMWRLGPELLALVIAAVSWLYLSRLVRGEVLTAKAGDYVTAARVTGATDWQIMARHVLPNILPVVIVWASLTLPALMLWEASLSYLGLGIQPPTASWGNMLSNAQRVWYRSAALVLLPGLAIYITVFAINMIGNGLRDALDPRLHE